MTQASNDSSQEPPDKSPAPQSSKYLRQIIIVSDSEKIKILMDKTRLKILQLLREGIMEGGKRRYELTVREMAEMLGISTPQSLYHHVDLLVENGFLYPAKEVKKKRSRITYYARTAPVFLIVNSLGEIPEYDEGIGQFAKMFVESLGLNLSEKEQDELVRLIIRFDQREAQVLAKYAPILKVEEEAESTWRKGLWLFAKLMMTTDEEAKDIAEKIAAIIRPKLEEKLKEIGE